jgi:hypothetical protein
VIGLKSLPVADARRWMGFMFSTRKPRFFPLSGTRDHMPIDKCGRGFEGASRCRAKVARSGTMKRTLAVR